MRRFARNDPPVSSRSDQPLNGTSVRTARWRNRTGRCGRGPTLTCVQPIYEVTIARPWHWGIVIVSCPGAALPDGVGNSLVVANSGAVVVKVRHAQDIEAEVFEGDWDWATATVHVRSLVELDSTPGEPLYEGELVLPEGRLAVGDADNEVVLNDLDAKTRIRVLASDPQPTGLTEVWIDLSPSGPDTP